MHNYSCTVWIYRLKASSLCTYQILMNPNSCRNKKQNRVVGIKIWSMSFMKRVSTLVALGIWCQVTLSLSVKQLLFIFSLQFSYFGAIWRASHESIFCVVENLTLTGTNLWGCWVHKPYQNITFKIRYLPEVIFVAKSGRGKYNRPLQRSVVSVRAAVHRSCASLVWAFLAA